jgi:general secretion pathway protein G
MTLIEIMVVLVILGMIASAIGINVMRQNDEAKARTAKLEAQAISNAVDMYRVKHSVLPDSLDQLVPGEIAHLHHDPWGSNYVFVRSGETFEILSYGPDRAQGGGDDITGEDSAKS